MRAAQLRLAQPGAFAAAGQVRSVSDKAARHVAGRPWRDAAGFVQCAPYGATHPGRAPVAAVAPCTGHLSGDKPAAQRCVLRCSCCSVWQALGAMGAMLQAAEPSSAGRADGQRRRRRAPGEGWTQAVGLQAHCQTSPAQSRWPADRGRSRTAGDSKMLHLQVARRQRQPRALLAAGRGATRLSVCVAHLALSCILLVLLRQLVLTRALVHLECVSVPHKGALDTGKPVSLQEQTPREPA